MPSITLHSDPAAHASDTYGRKGLPQLLQTPTGFAILEIQGTLHAPTPATKNNDRVDLTDHDPAISIGRLEFPLYNPHLTDAENTAWMKRAYLYLGKHQRMTGEVKKLPKPLAIIRKRSVDETLQDAENHKPDELEVVEIIRHKILFASRPEPVGD